MLSLDKILKDTSPLSIFLAKSGSGGNRLLFRYPFKDNYPDYQAADLALDGQLDQNQDLRQYLSVIREQDEVLSNIYAVNPNLCGQKFELKINNVRHVGHPMSLLQSSTNSSINNHSNNANNTSSCGNSHGDITSFNIVCALRSSASYDIVDCYHDLSKRIAIALIFEERRCSYLTREIKTIMATLEERDMAKLAEQDQPRASQSQQRPKYSSTAESPFPEEPEAQKESVYSLILNRSQLARDLKKVYDSLVSKGVVELKINNWINVSFCLPQKVHRLKLITHESMPAISTKDIKRCLLYLRPYHGLLLLQDQQELLDALPIDASPAFIQLIRVSKPDINFMDLSVDANLTLMQVFCIVSQLIYWAKATVIYPICDSNIYAIHPLASTGTKSKLVDDFKRRFPTSKSLHHYLADFSEGTSLSQINGPLLNIEEKVNLLNIVTWLLQRRILIQVHTYIFMVVERERCDKNKVRPQMSVEQAQSSPKGIEINGSSSGNQLFRSSLTNNSFESSPRMFKSSLSESFESSTRRFRADSLPESQEDSNFGLNSSLSSTPNSNLEYPSPGSCPMDNPLNSMEDRHILSALQRAGLTPHGAKVVMDVPSSRNSDDIRLLLRLIPYFDGRHHIEDIMFFENLERSQVLILCDKFRDILFTCHYEDVAVSQLSPLTSSK